MKKSLIAIVALAAAGFAFASPNASFDTQLNQAKAAIARIADAGETKSASFDTQLNQAKAAIARIAAENQKAVLEQPKK